LLTAFFNAGIKFLAQLNSAIEMHVNHHKAFDGFNNTFPPTTVERWNQMVIDWDKDATKPNPYEEPSDKKRNVLCCRIIKWHEVQMVYMPGAEQIIARAKFTTSTEQLDHAKHKKLFLPSSI